MTIAKQNSSQTSNRKINLLGYLIGKMMEPKDKARRYAWISIAKERFHYNKSDKRMNF